MISLRTEKTEKKYALFLLKGYDGSCLFCRLEKLIKKFKFWILVENSFPYDAIASKHHMLAPIRHISDSTSLNKEEIDEYNKIKEYIHKNYDWIFENTTGGRTIPRHYHLHLLSKL